MTAGQIDRLNTHDSLFWRRRISRRAAHRWSCRSLQPCSYPSGLETLEPRVLLAAAHAELAVNTPEIVLADAGSIDVLDAAAASSTARSAHQITAALLDNNLKVVDLSDLQGDLPLNVDSTTQILWHSEAWEQNSLTLGFTTIVKNDRGQNSDNKYYLYYAHHDPGSGIGVAVADTLTGPYAKISPPDSRVLIPSGGSPNQHFSSPAVVWNEDTQLWHMYFHFWNSDHYPWRNTMGQGFGHQMTALATTADLSSHNWTPLPGNPDVLNPVFRPVLPSTADRWINSQSSYHGIHRLPNGTWVAFLRGTGGEYDNDGQWLQDTTKIGIATSNDGINWNYLPQNPILHEGEGGRSGDYTPEFIGYLGNNESGQHEYLVVWNESGKIQYGTTTDFVNIQRDPRGHASWPSYGGADDVWREGDTLYLFSGRFVHQMILPVSSNRPPTTPGSIMATDVGARRATAQWGLTSDSDGDPITYELKYRKEDLSDNWSSIRSTTTTKYTITGLEPQIAYRVYVRANDGQDTSSWRRGIDLFTTTAANEAPTRPSELWVEKVEAKRALVGWTPSTDLNGDPITYALQHRKDDLSTPWSILIATTNTKRWLGDLEPGTSYRVRVLATDGQLVSAWWTETNLFTMDASGNLLAGDANQDGVVSADDYASVQSNFGNTDGAAGDANDDGVVSADDYASVQSNFGNTAGLQAAVSAAAAAQAPTAHFLFNETVSGTWAVSIEVTGDTAGLLAYSIWTRGVDPSQVSYEEGTIGDSFAPRGFQASTFVSGDMGGDFNADNFQGSGDAAIAGIAKDVVNNAGVIPGTTPHVQLDVSTL